MSELQSVEYRVREIKRYVVTRHYVHLGANTGGTETKGEYASPEVAYEVAYALCHSEHYALGWPVGDERIQYPESPNSANAVRAA